jgi:hypothetical protein
MFDITITYDFNPVLILDAVFRRNRKHIFKTTLITYAYFEPLGSFNACMANGPVRKFLLSHILKFHGDHLNNIEVSSFAIIHFSDSGQVFWWRAAIDESCQGRKH